MPGAEQRERLFIGVPLTDEARRAIANSLPKNLPGRMISPDKWHFTLRFLGATIQEVRDDLISRLYAARLGAPFRIRFGELGAFPNPRRARVLWIGLERGGEALSRLAAIAESSAQAAGFDPEGRGFTPHLTLSRINPPESVASIVAGKLRLEVEMIVDAVILYRSRLGGGPARYEEVARFKLSAS